MLNSFTATLHTTEFERLPGILQQPYDNYYYGNRTAIMHSCTVATSARTKSLNLNLTPEIR